MRRIAVAVLAAALAGCSLSTEDPASTILTGDFTLATIDNAALPVVETDNATSKTVLVSGRLSLYTDLHFMQVLNYETTSKSDGSKTTQQTVRNGTFVVQKDFIVFQIPNFRGDSPPQGWGATFGNNVIEFTGPIDSRVSLYRRD
jgi:hypothetical protein